MTAVWWLSRCCLASTPPLVITPTATTLPYRSPLRACSTVYWYLRPFGASMLVAGYDAEAKKHGERRAVHCRAVLRWRLCMSPAARCRCALSPSPSTRFALAQLASSCLPWLCVAWCHLPSRRVPAELYCVEPTGMALRYFGTAIGKGARAAKTEIEKEKLTDMTVEEALGHVAKM